MLHKTTALNDLKVFRKSPSETVAVGMVVDAWGIVGKTEWQIYVDFNFRQKDVTICFKNGDPLSLLKGLKFVETKTISNSQAAIMDIVEDAGFIDKILRQNTFYSVSPHLIELGITQKLIDDIPVSHFYYGMREICVCGIDDCYHSNMLILKYKDHFIIPFMLSFASPYHFFDFNIEAMKPIKEHDLNEEDEDDWENIFDEEMNFIGKKKPDFLSSHIAKRDDFKIEAACLFNISNKHIRS